MLDIKYIRENAEHVQKKSEQKGYKVDIAALLRLDDNRRKLLTKSEELRQTRNELSAQLKQGGRPSDEQIANGKAIKTELAEVEKLLESVEQEFYAKLKAVPNVPLDFVPVGASEDENVVLKEVGQKPSFDFEPKSHWEIGQARDWIDKERAAKVSGARFAYLKGDLVRLHWALINWARDQLTNQGVIEQIVKDNSLNVSTKPFVPVMPPLMIRTEVYEATARLDASEVTYKLADDDVWLNASAEHSMCPMYKDEIINEDELPIRYAGYATSFRREAGSYGKDVEGIFRLHQFDKLELESFTIPEAGLEEHKFMVAVQEYLMTQLRIPYRVLQKCTADIGGPNATGVDIDAWLPSQSKYRETHTADYITDYQTRRLQTRVRRKDGGLELVHTNDATAFSQRPLIAIIENNQNQDGTITVPEVLRPYIGGQTTL